MKKFLGILVLGLFWCGAVISAEKNITGFKKIEKSMPLKKVDRIKTVKKSDGFPVYEGETSIQVTVNNDKWEELPDHIVYYDSIKYRKPKKKESIKNKWKVEQLFL